MGVIAIRWGCRDHRRPMGNVLDNEAAEPGPLPGARLSLVLLLLINLFNYIDRSILFSVQETIRQEFGASNAAMGWLLTGFLVTYMILSPLFGWLADRHSRWVLIGIGV